MLLHLEARTFRNLEPLSVELGAGRHLILGPNGAGKTSLLEAVYLLATTRSFRTHRLVECTRHGADDFRLVGETARRQRLEVFLAEGDRERRLNHARTPLAEHLAALPLISWTAADGEVLTGPPAERRRFMDRGVIGLRPAALDVVSRYRHALDGKRRLLRSHRADAIQLAVWSDLQAAAGHELARERAGYVDRLREQFTGVLDEADLGLPPVELTYRPSPSAALDGADAYRTALDEVAEKERVLEQPMAGSQRDDLSLRWDGRAVRRLASAGERKALGLALLVAHGRVLSAAGVEPVALLDDVDVELDPERLARLWRILGRHRQVLVTSARPAVWQNLDVDHHWQVAAGNVRPGQAGSAGSIQGV